MEVHTDQTESKMPKGVLRSILTAMSILVLVIIFISSSYFRLEAIEVEGNKGLAKEEIIEISGIAEDANILSVGLDRTRDRLLQDLRIENVEASRILPNRIRLVVTERNPIFYAAGSYGFLEIDRKGTVLAVHKSMNRMDVPVLTGRQLSDLYVGDVVSDADLKQVSDYLANLPEDILKQISEINIKDPNRVYAYTTDSIYIDLGPIERLPEKANLTNEMLREITERSLAVQSIHLDYTVPFMKLRR
ncbi:MAG: FtsQ-type POTRA domain-containing protein [Selenomonadales bacterium]|nr:FtsQ-type POTRA domain-containing protein [Selenomonadales bacterium]